MHFCMTFMLLSYYLSSLNLKSIFTASYWAFDVHYKTWRAPSSSPKWGLGGGDGGGWGGVENFRGKFVWEGQKGRG